MTTKEVIETLKILKAEVEWNYPLDYAIAFDKAVEIIKQSEWVSVDDRLPDKDGRYLVGKFQEHKNTEYICVCDFTFNPYAIDKYEFARYKGQRTPIFYEYDSEWGYYELEDVTHWMPLPEPPKEVE